MVNQAILLTLAMFLVFAIPVSADVTYFDLSDPYNNTGTNDTTPDFYFRLRYNDSSSSAKCDVILNDTGYGFNSSVLNDTFTYITANETVTEGVYNYILNCTTNDGYNYESVNRILNIDNTPPNVTLVEPTPINGSLKRLNNDNPSFIINATWTDEGQIVECTAIINSFRINLDVYDGWCEGDIFFYDEGYQNYTVYVYDKGTYGFSETRYITIDVRTFIEDNPIFVLLPTVLWAVLVILLFVLWELWGNLSKDMVVEIGIGMIVIITFIITIITTLGLVS